MSSMIASLVGLARANFATSDSEDDYSARWDALGTSSGQENGTSSAEYAAMKYGISPDDWSADWRGSLMRATAIAGKFRKC